jgi:hypothetical protein
MLLFFFLSFSKQVSKLNFFFYQQISHLPPQSMVFIRVINYAFKNLFFISIKIGTCRNIGFKSIFSNFDLIKHKKIDPKKKISNLKKKKSEMVMLRPRFGFVLDLNMC